MTSRELLKAAAEHFGRGGYKRIAEKCGITDASIAAMNTGTAPVSPFVASVCAEILGMDPIAATIQAEADKDKERRDHWSRLLRRIATVGIVVAAAGTGGYQNAGTGEGTTPAKQAALTGLYIMRKILLPITSKETAWRGRAAFGWRWLALGINEVFFGKTTAGA